MINAKRIIDLERSLLCAYTMGADIRRANKECFLSEAHAAIFQAVKNLKARSTAPELIPLVSELERLKLLDTAGGEGYVSEIMSVLPSPANAAYYENSVLEAYRRRSARMAAVSAIEALDRGEDVEAALARMTKLEASAAADDDDYGGMSFKELIKKDFPPEDWFVDGLITTGLTVLTNLLKKSANRSIRLFYELL